MTEPQQGYLPALFRTLDQYSRRLYSGEPEGRQIDGRQTRQELQGTSRYAPQLFEDTALLRKGRKTPMITRQDFTADQTRLKILAIDLLEIYSKVHQYLNNSKTRFTNVYQSLEFFDILLVYTKHLEMYWVLFHLWGQKDFVMDETYNRSLSLHILSTMITDDRGRLLVYMKQAKYITDAIKQQYSVSNLNQLSTDNIIEAGIDALRLDSFIADILLDRNLKNIQSSQNLLNRMRGTDLPERIYEVYERRTDEIANDYLDIQNQFVQTLLVYLNILQNVCKLEVSQSYALEKAFYNSDTVIFVGTSVGIQPDIPEAKDVSNFNVPGLYSSYGQSNFMGYALLYDLQDYHNDLHEDSVYIEVICAQKGYGRYLIARIIQYATDAGYTHLSLSALSYVINYYRKFGFRLSSELNCVESEEIERAANAVANLQFANDSETVSNSEFLKFLQLLVDSHHTADKDCDDVESCNINGYPMTLCLAPNKQRSSEQKGESEEEKEAEEKEEEQREITRQRSRQPSPQETRTSTRSRQTTPIKSRQTTPIRSRQATPVRSEPRQRQTTPLRQAATEQEQLEKRPRYSLRSRQT